ncbi:TetR/AcrR family transcriptional regulator [Actinacidiphila rubida]|uniref:Transcriptional regulator, TetR family n=1 Tax=Actinacidiphila rubida TaxID=310780 RepID=A0A1H8PWZ3_9ACTN|nr:TetR/AcrR family transcriptional regulator [Actinacidiphila rubida]SEO46470.1 transcriptional regulator, TetR family [Actinacidiphila rubida]
MRVSRQQAAANRERVLDTAGELFRLRGLDGVTIADIMKAAGLTHGGFYLQFASKEALAEEACARGVRESVAALYESAVGPPDTPADGGSRHDALRRVVDDYLSVHRREDPHDACTVAALAADAWRGSPQMQEVFASGVTGMALAMGSVTGDPPAEGVPAAPDFPALATMIGAMVLSRAVHGSDPALSDRILEETRQRLIDGD